MVNVGYQKDDARIVDYQLWPLEGLHLRGPRPDLTKPYFSALGAAQTFGRFVESSFPALLGEHCKLGCVNLGLSGAGPSFFLRRPKLLELVNNGLFAIVQVMSGRSVQNSLVDLGVNQGVLIPKYDDLGSAPRFAEHVYKDFLKELSPIELELLRTQNRAALAAETIALLKRITVPKILLYWSTREPNYRENVTSLGGYWGEFPHFVNAQMLDAMESFADRSVRVVGGQGLPQALRDRHTREPVLMWPEEQFPGVRHRYANLYYPSPEMHLQVAQALQPECRQLAEDRRTAPLRMEVPVAASREDRYENYRTTENSSMSNQSVPGTEFGCPYDQYDPETLAPVNQNTVLRIAGLGWTKEDFTGKTVLDIGANTGFLSVQAAKLGAREVHATEVVQPAIDLIEYVARKHSLPIRASRSDFMRLQPATDAADVVLLMEVIQWIMRHGDVSVRDVISKLIRLTRETLYIEFPWDANDPQIRSMTSLTNETFNANLILAELSRYFRSVQFVRFMRYFGFDHSKGNRVLIKCTDLRPEAELLSVLDEVDSLDMPLSGTVGMKRSYLLHGKQGPLIAKIVRSGQFWRLPAAMQTRVIDELAAGKPKHLVLPIKLQGQFTVNSGGENWMVFPFVGAITRLGEQAPQFSPLEVISTARRVAVELNAVGETTMAALQDQKKLVLHLSSFKYFTPDFLDRVFELPAMRAVYEAALAHPVKSLDSLIHHDLHAGNMIRDGELIRVVDIDAMQLGTVCSDLVKAAIWYNCSAAQIAIEIEALEQALSRQIRPSEYAYAVGLWLSWFAQSAASDERVVLDRYASGLRNAASYFRERWK